jgi:hypothetical protein
MVSELGRECPKTDAKESAESEWIYNNFVATPLSQSCRLEHLDGRECTIRLDYSSRVMSS